MHIFKLLYLLSNGTGEKKEWPIWEVFDYVVAFLREHEVKMESVVGRLVCGHGSKSLQSTVA